jgi:hypothetical protein
MNGKRPYNDLDAVGLLVKSHMNFKKFSTKGL